MEVLVAKTDLGTGQVVGEGDIGWQTWPAASANSSFIRKTDRPDAVKDFVGAIVRTPVSSGEPIRNSKVVVAKGGGFMAAILPHGMRAITLDVSPETGAGGFILPNDHVNVVPDATRPGGGEDKGRREIRQRYDPEKRAGAGGGRRVPTPGPGSGVCTCGSWHA